MARQKPPSKAGAFWRAINVREDLAHGSAQGFVLKCCAAAQREELCPLAGQASLWRAKRGNRVVKLECRFCCFDKNQQDISKIKE